jgi:hypothetical protein
MRRGRVLIIAVVVLVACAAAGSASARDSVVGFQSPSKNIGCSLVSIDGHWGARCDIAQRTWSPPPKPRRCDLDFGQGVSMGSHGRAGYVCAGDTDLGFGKVLAYGHSITRGVIRCTSRVTGMTCVNTRHHHGFFISRDSVKLY